tara:strand:+ start:350 stop:514 length:165 start_codon:yes stop_codon:yes gene_type:complete
VEQEFFYQHVEAFFWTSSLFSQDGIYRKINYDSSEIYKWERDINAGMSIRCVAD